MLEKILFDNPEIDEAVRQYCESQPAYQALDAACQEKRKAADAALLELDDARNARWLYISQAYYHIGLDLRQGLSSALGLTAQSAS